MKFIAISKTSGEVNTHRRKNATPLYPLLPTLVVTTHLSISRRYFSQRLVWKMALWRSPSGWCLMHFEVIFTRSSRLTMQTIHCLNGSLWMVVSLQSPSLLTYLLTKFSRDSSVTSLKNGRRTHWPTQRLVTRWLHLVNSMHSGLSRRGTRFQKNLFGNRGKSMDTSQKRIWGRRRRRRVSQLSINPRNSYAPWLRTLPDMMQEWCGLMKQMTANPYFPRKTIMSVGKLELIKVLLCVGKCNNTELDIILFGDISMHINGSYCNQGSA